MRQFAWEAHRACVRWPDKRFGDQRIPTRTAYRVIMPIFLGFRGDQLLHRVPDCWKLLALNRRRISNLKWNGSKRIELGSV